MPSVNSVVLLGHLVADPELKYVSSGDAVLEFTVAVNERVKKGDEYVDNPSFIDCVVWGRQAEYISENAAKGDCVSVEGKIRQERWENADGEKRSRIRIAAFRTNLVKTKGT